MTVPVTCEERGGGQQQVEHGVVPLHHGELGSRVTSTVRDVHISTNLGMEGNGYIIVNKLCYQSFKRRFAKLSILLL